MIQNIIKMGHPTLRKVARPLTEDFVLSEEFEKLKTDLYDTMKSAGGIGIAAPQIDVSLSMALIELPAHSPRYGNLPQTELMVIVNPEITILGEKEDFMSNWEGCLSVPGIRGYVTRPSHIQLTYSTGEVDFQNGEKRLKKVSCEYQGFLAIVIQHELDHLFGKLFIDHIRDTKLLAYHDEYEEFLKGYTP